MPAVTPPVLWNPDPGRARESRIADFARWARSHRDSELDPCRDDIDYAGLHEWSVRDIDGFWSALAEYFGVIFHDPPSSTRGRRDMPGTEWFPGATVNYTEHALTLSPGRSDHDTAVIACREGSADRVISRGELRDLVARVRAGLVAAGVGMGDRVVAFAPNSVETLAAFLAAASLGAVWSCCSPDFGPRAVLDRFRQIAPSALIAVDGYSYNGKCFDVRETVAALQAELPTLALTVLVPHLDAHAALLNALSWAEFTAEASQLEFTPVPFDHPLWVVYSSGTTGLPKGIVHSHGGILLEHLKALALQHDLGPGDRFLWFTTTGWMMWNYLVSGLLVGATIVLYDGSPGYPDLDTLWAIADRHRISMFGASASYLQSCQKAGLAPSATHNLTGLTAVASTGSPLAPDQFRWLAETLGDHVQICSVSGGTDMCTAFLTSAPTVPVWTGELSCAALGADVHVVDEAGRDIADEIGELVINQPMPSMPVALWDDPGGNRLREAYFADFPGLWRHGDWAQATPRGSFIITGRSDSTLNRGGVRMGTADLYAVIENFDEVLDSLVVDIPSRERAGTSQLICFVVLADGLRLTDVEPKIRAALRGQLSPRHVPDRFLNIPAVPRTLNGKKCEVPVKRILSGADPEAAVSRDGLQDPDALKPFLKMAEEREATDRR